MQPPVGTIRHLFQKDNLWFNYYESHKASIRPEVKENIVKMLSCGLSVRGQALYECDTPGCQHIKIVRFTCKSRFCPSCGKKATESWIQTQNHILPKSEWQHITFTMPKTFWRLFDINRHLLNDLARLAWQSLQSICEQKKVKPAVFAALHTYGRDLQWHPHVHLSTTRGGLNEDESKWRTLYFKKRQLMKAWKYQVIKNFREHYKEGTLVLPDSLSALCPDIRAFNRWLNSLYQKYWIVHCAKPSNHHQQTVSYLGRYLKKPPIAQSRLRHYSGERIVFDYLNHRTGKHQDFTCSPDEFIRRFIQHIPPKNFRMIRYYGVLANKNRARLLPVVYQLLEQQIPDSPLPVRWAFLLKKELGIDPLACLICNERLKLKHITVGISTKQLMAKHEYLAKAKPIR